MIIDLSSILLLPLVVLAWAIDAYLFLLTVHLTLGRRVTVPELSDWKRSLKTLVNPLPTNVANRLSSIRPDLPGWVSWAVTVISLLIMRQVCFATVGTA